MTRAPTDGRRRKGLATRQAVIEATRRVFLSGNFRPTAKEIALQDGFSVRSVHAHFPQMEDCYRASIDRPTAQGMIALVPLRDEIEFALVLSLGKIERPT